MSDGRRGPISKRERQVALLALHAARPARKAPATGSDGPSAAELAALMDGRLSEADRERVLAELDASPDAYLAWLAAGAEAPDARGARVRAAVSVRRRGLAVAGLAASLLVGALVWWQSIPVPLERRIDAGLVVLAERAVPAPVSFARLGIIPRSRGEGALLDAKAGYRAGLRSLGLLEASPGESEPEPEPEPEAASRGLDVGFSAGRWVALIEAGTVVEPAPDVRFWMEQARVGQDLLAAIAALETEQPVLAEAVRGLTDDLLTAREGLSDSDWRERLASRVRASRLRLGLDWGGADPDD